MPWELTLTICMYILLALVTHGYLAACICTEKELENSTGAGAVAQWARCLPFMVLTLFDPQYPIGSPESPSGVISEHISQE